MYYNLGRIYKVNQEYDSAVSNYIQARALNPFEEKYKKAIQAVAQEMASNGDIYVSDGYGNSRVHVYSGEGQFKFSWGEPGIDPGQFIRPHNIAIDSDDRVYVVDREAHRIQIFDAKVQHDHGELKVKSHLKKIFIRNFNFTSDELYYFFKINKHFEIFSNLKKKLPNYIIKSIINLFFLRLTQCVYYFSKVAAFYKFKKLLNKNNQNN